MSKDTSFESLLSRLRQGNDEAAEKVVRQYTARLLDLARRQIGAKLARRVDPEDILQSAYRSLFLRLQEGQFSLGNGEDLWRLLVTITLNKIRRQANYHTAARRSINQEQSDPVEDLEGASSGFPTRAAEPTPDEAAALVDELDSFLDHLAEKEREIVQMRLQGRSAAEIAQRVGRAERSVRRVLERVMRRLEQRAEDEDQSDVNGSGV